MPEGPEVHRDAARLHAALAGQPVAVRLYMPRIAEWQPRLDGDVLESVRARGKGFLLSFGQGPVLFVHLQLYGRWVVRRAGPLPETGRALRLTLQTERSVAALYSASQVMVVRSPDRAERIAYIARLGPDALDTSVTRADVEARLEDPAFARRSLGALLLDQGFVAGLGNYLRSDILYEARLLPEKRPVDLRDDQRVALADAILRLPRRSLETGGITNEPDRVRRLRAEGMPRRALRHHVFGRDRRPCWTCGTLIERIEVGGRRLYLCPNCQH